MTPNSADTDAPFPVTPVPPELLAWARQTLDADAVEAELRAVLSSGGVPFEQVFDAVEAVVRAEL